ncbi:MAG TPA: DUF5671 domain-containing protein [Thermomicrobiales bacterium]|nr:DUF5671 domain-containing protein [Thermomicrobiales bacterium]
MLLARRLYLYFIAAISLVTLAVGLTNLLDLLFRWSWEQISGGSLLSSDPDVIRRQLSIHVALVTVSLPIWLLHWWLIERSDAQDAIRREEERRSTLRALYLTTGFTMAFIFWIVNAIRVVNAATRRVLDIDSTFWQRTNVESALAILLVTSGVWTLHAWTRIRDERAGPLEGPSDWLPRLYLLGAASAGALLVLSGVSDILALAVEAIAGDRSTITDGNWWSGIVADSVGPVVVGLGAWTLHWGHVLRTAAGRDWRAARFERSALHYVYIYLLALVGVLASLLFGSSALQELLRAALGGTPSSEPFVLRLVEPLARAVPFVAMWVYHRSLVLRGLDDAGKTAASNTPRRIYSYAIAFTGLAVGAFGLAATLYLSLDTLLDPSARIVDAGDGWRDDLSRFVALAIVGAAAWLWQWYVVQKSIALDPVEERSATPRRVYLLAVIAGSVMALLGSLAVVVYRILAALLNVAGAGLRADLSAPIAISVVAGAVLAYHGAILRADVAARPDPEHKRAEFSLSISGPAGASVEDVAEIVRAALPPDFEVRTGR